MFARFLASAACVLVAIPAASAILTFEREAIASVGRSASPGTSSHPPLGAMGDVESKALGDDPTVILSDRPAASAPVASPSTFVPGHLDGVTDASSVSGESADGTGTLFSSTAAATLRGSSDDAFERGILSFDGLPASATPVPFGDLVSAVSSGALSERYEFGSGGGGVRASFGVAGSTPAMTPVPLPPSSLPLLCAVGLLAFFRLRRT